MKREILPKIHSSGIFQLNGKLQNLLTAGMWYTCIAIRKIEEIEYEGLDPFREFYSPIGLDKSDFDKDVKNNSCVITLKSSSGQIIHFPSSFLKSFPISTGVAYSVQGIALDLGGLPVDSRLEELEAELQRVAMNFVGHKVRTRLLTLSNVELIDIETHRRYEAARQVNINSSDNLVSANRKLLEENNRLKEKNKNLEKWVVDYQEAIKNHPVSISGDGFDI